MSYFSKLFKSKEEMIKDVRAAQRRVARKLDGALDTMKQSLAEMNRTTDAFWEKAKVAARCGNQNERNRALMSYQKYSAMADKQESRLLWLVGKKCDFETARSLGTAVEALKEFAVAANIDPDKFADEIDIMMEVGADMDDAIGVMDRTVQAEESKIGLNSVATYTPDPSLIAQLEADVVGGTPAATVSTAAANAPAVGAADETYAKKIEEEIAAFEKK